MKARTIVGNSGSLETEAKEFAQRREDAKKTGNLNDLRRPGLKNEIETRIHGMNRIQAQKSNLIMPSLSLRALRLCVKPLQLSVIRRRESGLWLGPGAWQLAGRFARLMRR